MLRNRWLIAIALLALDGCTVGPKYKRPPIQVPDTYQGLIPESAPQAVGSIADEKWWTVFQDPELQTLIREAISQNFDLRIAPVHPVQMSACQQPGSRRLSKQVLPKSIFRCSGSSIFGENFGAPRRQQEPTYWRPNGLRRP